MLGATFKLMWLWLLMVRLSNRPDVVLLRSVYSLWCWMHMCSWGFNIGLTVRFFLTATTRSEMNDVLCVVLILWVLRCTCWLTASDGVQCDVETLFRWVKRYISGGTLWDCYSHGHDGLASSDARDLRLLFMCTDTRKFLSGRRWTSNATLRRMWIYI